MNLIANCGKRIILVAWIIFILFTWIFSFSCLLFVILVFLHLFYKRVEREITDDDINNIVSPIDAKVIEINIDEENQKIILTLDKTYCGLFLNSSEIRSVIKSDNIQIQAINGLKYNDNFYSNATKIAFNEEISCIFKPAKYCVKSIYNTNKALKGQRIGFFSVGLIDIVLPYNSTLLVGVGDKILANSNIARIGE